MATPETPNVEMDVGQEVRFAVVMYGGVSLAIYINGVAQELLHLVRATAPDPDDRSKPLVPQGEIAGTTAAVYRRVGQLLGRAGFDGGRPWTPGDPIRTRFVVDVLSGTSAGGINGIYLAKALAKGQDIGDLQRLWIEKGDLAELLNDRNLPPALRQDPPQALLSGRYMYQELLKAFDGMDAKAAGKPAPSRPYVDDVDCFVTTTDIRGLPVPLKLWDRVVEEKRHRNVFHFRYRGGAAIEPRNDFDAKRNRLLAFAARCTSAFPFAFEPMCADDALAPDSEADWDDFFPMYRVPPGADRNGADVYSWRTRAFGDGGYLDNKPFSYAIDALGARRATVPVDRKLLFVEPDPEQFDWVAARAEGRDRPNAVENVNAALSLARYETIREDLERILHRNRLVERVDRILSGMERDVTAATRQEDHFPQSTGYLARGLDQEIGRYGAAFGGYHRLKIAALTDDLSATMASAAGFDPDSDQARAIREVVRIWRDRNYVENKDPKKPTDERRTQNEFLFRFDLPYRLRRLTFVLGKIDELFCLNDKTQTIMTAWGEPMPTDGPERAAFRRELTRLTKGLGDAHRALRRVRATLAAAPGLAEAIARTGLDANLLQAILRASKDTLENVVAPVCEGERAQALDAIAQIVADRMAAATIPVGEQCEALLHGGETAAGEPAVATAARRVVLGYYKSFERYDMIAYPILFSTEVGEEMDAIEVVRVSPQDASLIRAEGKLAGVSFGHFGAFLDRGWRMNDILWGRLDAAERLITVLLRGTDHPDSLRRDLVADAHRAILKETYDQVGRDRLCQLLSDAIAKEAAGSPSLEGLQALVAAAPGMVSAKVRDALTACLDPDQLLAFFQSGYHFDPNLDRRAMTDTIGRATRITGLLLGDIAERERVTQLPTAWLARVGMALSALVEVAVPSNVGGLVGRRLLAALVFFEVFLILGGMVFATEPVQRFGIVTLGLTAVLWGAVWALGDFIERRRPRGRGPAAAAPVQTTTS